MNKTAAVSTQKNTPEKLVVTQYGFWGARPPREQPTTPSSSAFGASKQGKGGSFWRKIQSEGALNRSRGRLRSPNQNVNSGATEKSCFFCINPLFWPCK
jgi:hypothetical protein